MLRIIAILVVGFYVILWASGNDLNSLRAAMVHWADGNGQGLAANNRTSDWGRN